MPSHLLSDLGGEFEREFRQELEAMGTDAMKYGGCSETGGSDTFSCGTATCNTANEICEISINDAIFPGAPLFYNSCWMLPSGCTQGDCSCISTPGFPWDPVCYDGTGHTIVVYPGG